MQPIENVRPMLVYRRDSQYITLTPENLERLGGDVTAGKRVPVDDVVHGYDVGETRESLLLGQRIPNAGLIDWLRYRAHTSGYQLTETCELPIATLPEPANRDQLEYPAWAEFVHCEHRGLVKVSTSVDIAVLIAELAVAFPSSRIMLLGRVNDLKPVYDRLLTLVPNEVLQQKQLAFVHGGRPLRQSGDDDFPRIICCTPTAAADLESEKCDIVVMHDAFECLHQLMALPLIQVDARFRLFGILRSDRSPKPYEQARLHQVLGFRQLNLMDRGRVRREVCSAWIRQRGQAPTGTVLERPGVGGRQVTQSVDPLQAYVHNHQRNDTITRLAKQLRAGQPIENHRLQEIATWCVNRERQPRRVMIVVDQLDHAVQLHRQLPDWPIVAGESNLDGIPAAVRRWINRCVSQWLPCQIVVADAVRRTKGHHADVVIWASGGAMVDIPEEWLYTRADSGHPLLIVDFVDDFAPAARRLSRQRSDSLDARDIFRVGEPPVLGRIRQFERQIGEAR